MASRAFYLVTHRAVIIGCRPLQALADALLP